MSIMVTLSDAEAAELECILTAQVKETLVEVHRTNRKEFRREIQHRLESQERILDVLRRAQRESVVSR